MTTTTTAASSDVTRAMRVLDAIAHAARVESRELQRAYGLTLAQLVALQRLADEPAKSLNDFAARTGTHQSSVSVVAKQLVEKGLVERNVSTDRRRAEFALTDAGYALLERVPPTVYQRLEYQLAAMSRDHRGLFVGFFAEWVTAAGLGR